MRVIDRGDSRCALIPLTRNHAGFPDGISGVDLLDRMRDQAKRYGAEIVEGDCERIERDGDNFVIHGPREPFAARTALLATGVVNRRPDMDDALHSDALSRGLIRYCPVCDGYEVTDAEVAVVGTGERGCAEAVFLRSYTGAVTLLAPDGPHDLTAEQRTSLAQGGIEVVDGPARRYRIEGDRIALDVGGMERDFASLYPALGSTIRSELMAPLGGNRTGEGCVLVDNHQRTDIPGLYAAGDVVQGLDQISHAMGEAGVAATTIRNDLAGRAPLRR